MKSGAKFIGEFCYTYSKSVFMLCGAEEACPAHNRKVGGSKPPKATRIQLTEHAQALAQLVERSTVEVYKHRTAAGSIPASLK